MQRVTLVNPTELEKPLGYSHGIVAANSRLLYIAGQIAHDVTGVMVAPGDLVGQFRQICENIKTIVETAGGTLTDVIKLNMYVTDPDDYRHKQPEIGKIYREYFGKHFPAMTLIGSNRLYPSYEGGVIEIEGVAALSA